MDSNAKVIPLHLYPMGFIEGFTSFGADLSSLLRNTGIDESFLASKSVKISYAQQGRLIANGVALCRVPGLGLRMGLGWDWGYHGTVGYVAYCSPSMRDAGEAFRRYLMIAQPHGVLSATKPVGYIDPNGKYVHPIRCVFPRQTSPELRQFELEFRLATTLKFWDACGNKSVPDPSVHVQLECPEPPHSHLYGKLPCGSVRFGCKQSHVSAHKSFITEPFRPYRRGAFERLLEHCEEELRKARLEKSYTERVRAYVSAHFNKQASLDDTAQKLGMSPRALTRRLASENTTFRNILREVRMELTLYHLRASRLGVEEIAHLMGFSCASSMRRAVKSASGQTVGMIRAKAS